MKDDSGNYRSKPRILHLRTVTGHGGGPEKTLLGGPAYLQDDYVVRLLYIRPRVDPLYDMPQRAELAQVDLVDVPECCGADPRTIRRVAREIRKFGPDILHAHDYKTNALCLLLGKMFRLAVVTTMHGYVGREKRLPLYYLLDRLTLRWMDHVVVVSRDLYESVRRLGIGTDRISFIENGIDTRLYARHTDRAEAKRRLGFDTERFLIGGVGRLAKEKGFDLSIRAVHRLAEEGSNVELVILGDGQCSGELEGLADRLGISDRIHLAGHQSNTIEYYEAMDLFVLSSHREGLPNVLLEAMAMEVPVVATRIAGVPSLIRHGQNGLLVEPGDEESLYQAIGRLRRSGDYRKQLLEAARETVENEFDFEQRMKKMTRVYRQVLERANR